MLVITAYARMSEGFVYYTCQKENSCGWGARMRLGCVESSHHRNHDAQKPHTRRDQK